MISYLKSNRKCWFFPSSGLELLLFVLTHEKEGKIWEVFPEFRATL